MAALASVGSWVRDVARAIAGRTRASDVNTDPTWTWPDYLKRALRGEISNAFKEHPWVFRSVMTIVNHLAGVPLILQQGQSDSPKPIESGPWYDLFLKPSSELTRRELWALTTHYFLGGGAYWVLYGRLDLIKSEREVPSEIQVWPASAIEPKRVEGKLHHYELQIDRGQRVNLELFQVVPLRIVDPDSPLKGIDVLGPGKRAVRTDDKAARWNEGLLDNDATPGGILSSDEMLTDDQVKAIKKRWRDLHGGPDKHGDIAVLGAGSKFQSTAITPKDMGFIEARKWSKDEIAGVYGVPLIYLGDMKDLHSKESSRQAAKMLWQMTLCPILDAWVDILEARLFRPRGGVWGKFDLSGVEALQEEIDARIANAKSARDLGVPRNELNRRFELGFEFDDEAGDVGLVPMALQPIEAAEGLLDDPVEPIAPPPPEPPPVNDIDPEPDPEDPGEAPEGEDEGGRIFTVRAARRSSHREAIWRNYLNSIKPYQRRMAKTVRGYWRRLRSDTLDAVAKLAEDRSFWAQARELTNETLQSWLAEQHDRWQEKLVERTKPIETSVIESALERLEGQIGQSLAVVDMTHPSILKLLADRGAEKVRVVDTVQKGIRNTILEGLAENENLVQIQDRVRNVFRVANARTMAIAQTETAAAAQGANYAGMKGEGVQQHSWLSSGDDNVRDSHQIDGETRALDSPFSNGLLYPLDPEGPPEEVIRCHCTTLPEG